MSFFLIHVYILFLFIVLFILVPESVNTAMRGKLLVQLMSVCLCLLGQPKYGFAYSKQSHQWVAKPIYQKTSQAFTQDLVERVFQRREEESMEPWPRPKPHRRRLLQNIAPVPRPDPKELIQKRRSRFQDN